MTEIFEKYSLRLFKKRPSFKEGVSALIDMSPLQNRYNYDENDKEADMNSLQADWCAIGDDMWQVIQQHEQKSK